MRWLEARLRRELSPCSRAARRAIAIGGILLLHLTGAHCAQEWVQHYDGGSGNDAAMAVATDAGGNVFVTGLSFTSNRSDTVTIKYSPAGIPLWTNRFNESAYGNNTPHGLAVDPDGNVVVAASCTSTNGFYDYATIKYSNAGVPLWTNQYNGPGNGDDTLAGLAIGKGGTVFVTGASAASNTGYPYYDSRNFDCATVAYSSGGVPLWTNRYDGPGKSDDFATAIAVDTNGNVLVTGQSGMTGGTNDIVTLEYSATGVPLWTNRYPAVNIEGNYPYAIASDQDGNVFVTGHAASATYFDYVTLKYSSAGVPLWTNSYAGTRAGVDEAKAIAVDRQGNAFVTGYSAGINNAWGYLTIKYSPGGTALWTNEYSAMTNGSDDATAIALDGSGNVIVTGNSLGNGTSDDIVTIVYSNDGAPLSTNRFISNGNYNDQANSVATVSSGNILVAGLSEKPTGDTEFTLIKYSAVSGPLLRTQSLPGKVVLSWDDSLFRLQAGGSLATFTNVPGATSPFTNVVSVPQQFFRLVSK
jgi:uncharacterized delta-60 repeat protein